MATITKKVRRKLRRQNIPIPPKKRGNRVIRVNPITGKKILPIVSDKERLGL